MTQDEIIEMAIQGHASTRDAIRWAMNQEREACADLCEQYGFNNHCGITTDVIAIEIRARGQA
jgi:hypothetical protein